MDIETESPRYHSTCEDKSSPLIGSIKPLALTRLPSDTVYSDISIRCVSSGAIVSWYAVMSTLSTYRLSVFTSKPDLLRHSFLLYVGRIYLAIGLVNRFFSKNTDKILVFR